MTLTRREAFIAGAGTLTATIINAEPPAEPRKRMGVVIHSYGLRRGADRKFDDPLTFLDYCRSIGAGGVQTGLGVRDDAYAAKLQERATAHTLFVEGSIALPRDRADVERFTAEVRTARRCGAELFRTVLMNGRRYETFDTAEAFRTFLAKARESLALALPVVEKQGVGMAIENHKDLQAPDLLELVKKFDSPLVGICLDFGNNLALLEQPLQTAGLLASRVFTTHVKDVGVEECPDGFLLAEVPLGTGFLDLPKMVAVTRKANPSVRLNLEMITRDPLKIACLMPKYWATLESVPGRQLAEILTLVRAKATKNPLPRISALARDAQLAWEDDNVRQSLRYAAEKLDG